jgi:hypothetical protein
LEVLLEVMTLLVGQSPKPRYLGFPDRHGTKQRRCMAAQQNTGSGCQTWAARRPDFMDLRSDTMPFPAPARLHESLMLTADSYAGRQETANEQEFSGTKSRIAMWFVGAKQAIAL